MNISILELTENFTFCSEMVLLRDILRAVRGEIFINHTSYEMHRFSKLNSRNVSNPIKNESKIDCPPERETMANEYIKTHITGLGEMA